jgi:GNAT superfamily N-acetyltransferase
LVNFSQLSSAQLIKFVDEHFDLFANERDGEFPANVLSDLERDRVATVHRIEGFAIAFKGRRHQSSPGGTPADLMFLYVQPEYQGQGIGKALVEAVRQLVTPGVPFTLKCEGMRRKEFFSRLGFAVTEYCEAGDLYEMQWSAMAQDVA